MVNGLYTAAESMMLLQKKQDVASHNLSNLNTTGFKRSLLLTMTEVTHRRNDESKLHQDEDQNMHEVFTAFEPGALVQTDNPLDFALSEKGFFTIRTPEGVRYTRNGSFTTNEEGELVTLKGHHVLQDNEDIIHINPEEKLTIASDGGMFVNGIKRGQLGIVEFANPHALLATGGNLFENPDPTVNPPTPSLEYQVRQGFLEGSNVDMIRTMVEMIAQFRNYEASQKTMHAIDDTISKAVNEVARLS